MKEALIQFGFVVASTLITFISYLIYFMGAWIACDNNFNSGICLFFFGSLYMLPVVFIFNLALFNKIYLYITNKGYQFATRRKVIDKILLICTAIFILYTVVTLLYPSVIYPSIVEIFT